MSLCESSFGLVMLFFIMQVSHTEVGRGRGDSEVMKGLGFRFRGVGLIFLAVFRS